MKILSNLIIIGATGRNTGKTEFACRLIERYSKDFPVVGVKVTAINRNEGGCPRGKESCGVCDSLTGEFSVTEETRSDKLKDTSKMLKAGAQKVLWLKVDHRCLEKGFAELARHLPEQALIVCESNSLRKVVEPGLFLVIRKAHEKRIKKSCFEVIHFADKIVSFDHPSWDVAPDRVQVKNGRWILKEQATAIILAGGKGSRMGGIDKGLIPIGGQPLITHIIRQLEDHFDEIIIGTNEAGQYAFLNHKTVPDDIKDQGPLMGILSCLKASASEVNFITACDIPVMNIRLIRNMINLSAGVGAVMPVAGNDKYEPLYAVYRKSVIKAAEQVLSRRGRRIIELLKYVPVKLIPFDDAQWYQNLNTKEELQQYITKTGRQQCNMEDS
jgi:molybdopterin-guanine dinucleotide biosynthesis protein A